MMLMSIAHTSLAEPESNLEDQSMYEGEWSLREKQHNVDEILTSDDVNLQSVPALSLNDLYKRNVKEWSEQSFIRAIKSLGILKMPGLKLVKVPKSMIMTMKRMPNHTIVRPHRYVQPKSKVQYDVPQSQCEEVLQVMFTLAHASGNLAFRVQTLKCIGSCSNGHACILRKKSMVVYVMSASNLLYPKSIDVGCSCVCM